MVVTPSATAPELGVKVGVESWALSLVTVIVYVLGVFPVSVAMTVITAGTPAVRAVEEDVPPEETVSPLTVIVPAPVGVTVMPDTPLATVTEE